MDELPTTETAQFWRRVLARDLDVLDSMVDDDPEITRCFVVGVARHCFPDGDVDAVVAYARQACARGTARLRPTNVLLTEACLRNALGDVHILDGLTAEQIADGWIRILFDLVDNGGLSATDIDRLLLTAEAHAAVPTSNDTSPS